MIPALFLILFVETLKEFGESVWNAFVDDVGVHGAKLLADLVLDLCTEAALLVLGFVSLHCVVIRRLSWSLVHFIVPPCPMEPIAAGWPLSLWHQQSNSGLVPSWNFLRYLAFYEGGVRDEGRQCPGR
jgi:hypothetical protein